MKQLIRIVAVLAVVSAPAQAAGPAAPAPDPSLSPQDVVRIQIEALRDNDTPYKDRGIEVTYRFASPGNRRTTGSLAQFAAMVRSPPYGPMIGHRTAAYENVEIAGDVARIDVVLVSGKGRYLGYRFVLSRQRGNEYEGSWMTDAVIPFEVTST